MKKIILLLACAMLLAFVVGCKKKAENVEVVAVPAVTEKFIVGLDDSFPPMGFRNEDNKIVGFDIDLATEVAKRIGMELVLQPIDWASKELELNNNNISCIWNGLSVDPARAEAMLLSKPYLANNMIFIVRADSPVTTKEHLKGKQVAVQAGSTAVKSLQKSDIYPTVKMVEYESNVLALSDLKIGRVDAVVVDEVVARYKVSKELTLYRILDYTLDEEVYAIGFKKGNTQLVEKVEKALEDMKADGTSARISTKWFGQDIILK